MTRSEEIVQEAVNESKNVRGRRVVAVAVFGTLLFAFIAAIAGTAAYVAVKDAAQRGTSLAEQVQTACADPSVDERELGTLCDNADAVVEKAPEAAQGPPGPKGDTGDPGVAGEQGPPPSSAQVANAVASYCSVGRCDGEDGQDGRDGKNVTASQVANAVALYCNDRGECRGPEGATGAAGQDGADGEVGDTGARGPQGEQGPAPTNDQVIAAVASYCADRNGCQGPAGAQGERGEPGAAGEPGTPAVPFTFTFTIPAEPPTQEARSYSCTVQAPSTTANCVPA